MALRGGSIWVKCGEGRAYRPQADSAPGPAYWPQADSRAPKWTGSWVKKAAPKGCKDIVPGGSLAVLFEGALFFGVQFGEHLGQSQEEDGAHDEACADELAGSREVVAFKDDGKQDRGRDAGED